MVPRIGDYSIRLQTSPFTHRVAVKQLLGHYRDHRYSQSNPPRRRQLLAANARYDEPETVDKQPYTCQKQDDTDDHCGESLKLSVAVTVVFVAGFPRDSYKQQYDYIGDKVGKRVNSIGHQCRTVAEYACDKLYGHEHGVDSRPCYRDPIDFFLS